MTTVRAGHQRTAQHTQSSAVLDGHWRLRAACRLMPADMFFPVGTTGAAQDELAAARAVCSGCDVRPHCLDFSLATRQEFGIWGGMDEEERRHLLRDSRAPRRLR